MASIPSIEFASNGGFLWPPVADGLDTYIRRRHQGAGPYEIVWRLIHVWEAVIITLAAASMARAKESDLDGTLSLRQREFFYGKLWDPVTASFKKLQGAADGAIDQWINVLEETVKAEESPGRFLPALKDFLNSESIDIAPLLLAWSKACDVPPDYKAHGTIPVRTAMRYVNSFRNRFAHVPFPHDLLQDIAEALELATEQLFSVPPSPTSHEKDGVSSPLTGAFRLGRCFLHGSHLDSVPHGEPRDDLQFVFPCQKRNSPESWPASVLVHIDSMVRPHILTRVKGVDVCEYTRFRAEANAIIILTDSKISACLPEPDTRNYKSESTDDTLNSAGRTQEPAYASALQAIRDGDFDSGIKYFAELVQTRPDYHVGWLRLGHARREKAARSVSDDVDSATQLLNQALGDLETASHHIDPAYKALAHYERSKAALRLAGISENREQLESLARAEAIDACRLSTELKFQTWLNYVEARVSSRTAGIVSTQQKGEPSAINSDLR